MARMSARLSAVVLSTFAVWIVLSGQPSHGQAPADTIALTGARLIDGTGRPPLQKGAVVIKNGRVEAVGAPSAVTIPSGATRIDVAGKTIIPGLINAHGHLDADTSDRPIRDKLAGQLRVYADSGGQGAQVSG